MRRAGLLAVCGVLLAGCSGASAPVLPYCYGASRSSQAYECAADYKGIDSTRATPPAEDGEEAGVKDTGEVCACPSGTACFTADVGAGTASVFCALVAGQ